MTSPPRGWAEARLDEVAEVRLGRQRSPKNHFGSRMRPYLRAANVTWSGLDLGDVKEMNFTEEESAVYELRRGDVLVAEASGSADEVGKPALWKGEVDSCCFQNTLVRVRTLGPLPEYLRYFLLAEAQSGRIGRASPGVGIHHIGAARLAAWRIAIPPLAEQKRIVEAIEEQLSRLDTQSAEIRRAIRRSLQLRRELLRSIVPTPLPSHWRLSVVEDVGAAGLGRQRAPQYHDGEQMRPYLRVANVLEDRLDLTDVMEMDFPGDQADRYRLRPGDILLNEGQTPDLVGRPAMFRGEIDDLCFSKTLLRFRAGPDVDSEFALLVFLSYLHSGRFRREARITTNIGHMVLARFKRIEFPLPPMTEQRDIVDRVRAQLSKLDKAQSDLNAALRKSSALRRAILASAFRGELVPQNPDDEPASLLLERIANQRAASPRRARKAKEKATA